MSPNIPTSSLYCMYHNCISFLTNLSTCVGLLPTLTCGEFRSLYLSYVYIKMSQYTTCRQSIALYHLNQKLPSPSPTQLISYLVVDDDGRASKANLSMYIYSEWVEAFILLCMGCVQLVIHPYAFFTQN